MLSYDTLLKNQAKTIPLKAEKFALFNQYWGSLRFNKKKRYGQPRYFSRTQYVSYFPHIKHPSWNENNNQYEF